MSERPSLLNKNNSTIDSVLLVISIVYRLLILFLIKTTFVPDEYYQYVEPSYELVYGQSIR
jgi:hypothetical protein